MATITAPTKVTRSRVNRSVSFPTRVLQILKARAKKENRSVNYLVNQAVAKDNGMTIS